MLTAQSKEVATLPSEKQIYYELTESGGRFGIAAKNKEGKEVIPALKDITRDRKRIERFVDLCNRLNLSITHLYDAVEDFIG